MGGGGDIEGGKTAVNFSFENVVFDIDQGSKGVKHILKSCSGIAKGGEVLAIMGPSGAGKTMLLNVLTLEDGPGNVTAAVELNGKPFTRKVFEEHCAIVTQVDRHWAFLTCREHVEIAADLFLSGTPEEKKSKVDAMLKRMGLEVCADTKVGNEFLAGLSGGQKRRLSLAIALMKMPLMVFLDEPTSGLDAAAAASIMQFLRELTHEMGICVVTTIHQPSSKVYAGFDDCLILSSGRVAYTGPSSKLQQYLEADAKQVSPGDTSTAEWVLDLVNREFTDPAEVDKLLDQWPEHESKYTSWSGTGNSISLPAKGEGYGTSFGSQTLTLLKRHGLLTIRDPTLYLGRFFAFMFACLFFSVIYVEHADRTQEAAPYRMFLLMWHLGVPTSLGVVAVYALNLEYFAIKKEIKNGMYSPWAYVTATGLLEIPLMFILSIGALSLGGYAVSEYDASNYVPFVFAYTVTLWSFECMARFFSIMFDNSLLGMLMYMNMWFASFLFAGIMVPEEDVIWPFRVLVYITPYRWSLSNMLYVDLRDTTFSGAELTMGPDGEPDGGFVCPEQASGLQCYGYTGKQVLDSIGVTYKCFSSEDNYWRDILIVVAIAMVFKIQYIGLLIMKVTSNRQPHLEGGTLRKSEAQA